MRGPLGADGGDGRAPGPGGAPGPRAELPLFPLALVLLPGLQLPLHVFEARYRALVAHLLTLPPAQREFGVVAIRDGHEVGVDTQPALHRVGTVARLEAYEPFPDGRFAVHTVGTRRFEVLDVHAGAPWWTGTVRYLDEPAEPADCSGAAPARVALALYLQELRRVRDRVRDAAPDEPPDADPAADPTGAPERRGAPPAADPSLVLHPALNPGMAPPAAAAALAASDTDPGAATALSYLLAASAVLELAERQDLLECPDTATRLRAVTTVLRRERALLRALPALPAGGAVRLPVSLN